MHGPGYGRVEERDDPQVELSADAVIRLAATCVCGSGLWLYRGIESPAWSVPMGHEYWGVVEQVGSEVSTTRPGQFVVGSSCFGQHLRDLPGGLPVRLHPPRGCRCP